jgi:hypothetical protein
VFQVLVPVAGLENVIEQLDQGTRKEVQLSRCSKKQAWGKIITEVHRTLVFLIMCYPSFFAIFFQIFFIFFYFVAAHKKIIHQVSDFLCNDATSGISASLP